MIPSYRVRVRVRCGNFVDSYLGMTLKEELLLHNIYFFYTLSHVGVYTSPGRWTLHCRTLPPKKKNWQCIGSVCIHFSIIYIHFSRTSIYFIAFVNEY